MFFSGRQATRDKPSATAARKDLPWHHSCMYYVLKL
jgi:hypothetical protein